MQKPILCIGAQKLPRVREGFSAGLRMVWLLCVPLVALYILAGHVLVGFFMNDPSSTAMATGITILRVLSPFYFVVSAKLVADGILRGAGLMSKFMVATFTDLIIRVVLAYAFSHTSLGATAIWYAWPNGWTIACVLSILFYTTGPWRRKAKQEASAA